MVKVYFQMLKGSLLCSQWWVLTNPIFNVCPDNLQGWKNEGARVVTTLLINFSDAQGQLTLKSVMNLAEIQTDPSFNSCPYCMQEWGRSI